jgi:hypothetical protein
MPATKVKFSKAAVLSLFGELGLPADASKYDDKKILKRIGEIDKLVDDETKPTTEEGEQLLAEIQAAVKDGDDISIEDDAAPAKGKGKAGKAPAKAPAKGKGGKEKAAKPAREAAERDKFGARLGTDVAKFNAALTAKPQKMADIVKKAGLKGTFYNHANKLVENGFLIKSDDGLALNPKKDK